MEKSYQPARNTSQSCVYLGFNVKALKEKF